LLAQQHPAFRQKLHTVRGATRAICGSINHPDNALSDLSIRNARVALARGEFLDEGRVLLGEQIKPEMISIADRVGPESARTSRRPAPTSRVWRAIISSLAQTTEPEDRRASTHPISRWQDQEIFRRRSYELSDPGTETVALSLLIFGLHVHVGIADRERQIHITDIASRYFLPHVLA